ncbi:unnamed protein product, partial [Closterium sp. NIES-53]
LLCLARVGLSPTGPSCGTTVLATRRSLPSALWLVTVLSQVSLASSRRSLPRLHPHALLAVLRGSATFWWSSTTSPGTPWCFLSRR